jgi:hypothetical protein
MIAILEQNRIRLQKELAEQCVNDTESILHDLDWWGGLDLPEGYAFDFNVYETENGLKAVAYFCDERDDLGHPKSSYAYSIDLEVPQFLVDQYQLRKGNQSKKFNTRVFFNANFELEVEADDWLSARDRARDIACDMTVEELMEKLNLSYDFVEVFE